MVVDETTKSSRKFLVNFNDAIARFENTMQKFPVKKILYKIIFRGKGLEFDSYRQFEPDDDSVLLDWKASLRSNGLLARKYVEERELNIYFVIDVSNSMLFGSEKRLKAEYVSEVVVALSHLILNSGDRVGLIMFDDGIKKFLPASNSRNQFPLIRNFLINTNLYGGNFNLDGVIDYSLRAIKTPYTIFILISDFVKVKKKTEKSLKLLGAKFETMAIIVRDPFDEELPETKYQLSIQDPSSGRQIILDTEIARKRYRANVVKQKTALKSIMRKSGIDVLELNTKVPFFVPVSLFLKSRAFGTRL